MHNKNTLHSIQALRAFAAILVVVLHSFVHLQVRHLIPTVPALVSTGRVGVDIFFVISGFIMVYISEERFGAKGASSDFLCRRIIRVAPTYWLYSLVMGALLFSFPHSFSEGKTFSAAHMLASMSFIPWANSLGHIKPVLNVGWTLNYEMYFYCIFAILLLFGRKYMLPLLSLILLSGAMAGALIRPQAPIFSVVTSSLPIEFLFGCFIAVTYRRRPKLSPALCLVLIFSGIGMLVMTGVWGAPGVPRAIKWGTGSALLVAGMLFLESNGKLHVPAFVTALGNSSYSLYLTHLFTINALGEAWTLLIGRDYELFLVVAIATSVFAGHVAYRLIERPLTSYLHRLYYRSRDRAAARAQAGLAG